MLKFIGPAFETNLDLNSTNHEVQKYIINPKINTPSVLQAVSNF